MDLSSPHSLAVNSHTKDLFIADTRHHRLLQFPTQTHNLYRVRFWVLISGPDRDSIVRAGPVFDAVMQKTLDITFGRGEIPVTYRPSVLRSAKSYLLFPALEETLAMCSGGFF